MMRMFHGWRTKGRRAASALPVLAAALLGCGSTEELDGGGAEVVTTTAQGVSCTVIRRTAIAPGAVTDATIAFDPVDPTRAVANYGALTLLNIGTQATATRISLVQFDLSPIPANVPIQSATLDLSVATATGVGTAEVHRVTGPWAESTVTWTSFGNAYDTTVLGTFLPKSLPTNGHALIGVTSLVQAWNAGTQPNHGVAVLETSGARAQLGASEVGNAALRPALTVCYSSPTCNDGLQNQGEGGVDCGGPCTPCYGQPATDFVGAGTKASSPSYSVVYTLGQPTQNQGTSTSPSYRAQGGVVGATGTLP